MALLDLPLTREDNAAARDNGPPVTLRARFANREWEWRGRVVRTAASMDENSRVVYAVAEVHEPFARDAASERPPLLPGMFVDAAIGGRPLPGVSRLPRSALRSDGSVAIVDGNQRTRVKSVRLLDSDPGIAWVQGLEAGDRVVVREPGRLVAGTEVRVKTAAELAGGKAVARGEAAR
ncbi:MAG: hypothetical protein U5K56_12535 [Halioglobus sp.]|nr:hypothetical protein [Halioglobus sp.]